jgi:ABC-type glutathione transport system ATPase component
MTATTGMKAKVSGVRAAIMRAVCSAAGCETSTPETTPVPVELGRKPIPATPGDRVPATGAASRLGGAPRGAVVAEALTKVYANGVRAVENVSIRADSGEIVAIVGPNGAGKSTTLNMLTTLVKPTSGTASVLGVPVTDARRVSRLIGVALQSSGLDPVMTGIEHFETQAVLYEVSPAMSKARTAKLLQQFSLEPFADRQVGLYSGGLQRRLALALALLHDPRS